MLEDLRKGQAELAPRRAETEADLLRFVMTDVLLFWSNQEDLYQRQAELWQPVLDWVADKCGAPILTTTGLDVPEQDMRLGQVLQQSLAQMSLKKLAAMSAAALDMRSVLLAWALVERRISAEEAYQAAWLEEIWQAEKWGSDEEAESKRQLYRRNLAEVETFLNMAA